MSSIYSGQDAFIGAIEQGVDNMRGSPDSLPPLATVLPSSPLENATTGAQASPVQIQAINVTLVDLDSSNRTTDLFTSIIEGTRAWLNRSFRGNERTIAI